MNKMPNEPISPFGTDATPMSAAVRIAVGLRRAALFTLAGPAMVLLGPVPQVDLDLRRAEKVQADRELAKRRDATANASPADRESTAAQEALAAKNAADKSRVLRQAEEQ